MSINKAFVVLSQARCGTHMVASSLNSHPELTCHPEVFHPEFNNGDRRFAGLSVEEIYRRHTGPQTGFVTHDYNVHNGAASRSDELWPIIRREKPKVVILGRLDLLRRCASLRNASIRGVWGETDPPRSFPPPLEFTPEEVARSIDQYQETLAKYNALFPDALHVAYETLWRDRQRGFGLIQDFLGVERRPLTCRWVKQDPRPIESIVGNFAALEDHFPGTDYGRYFDIARQGHS